MSQVTVSSVFIQGRSNSVLRLCGKRLYNGTFPGISKTAGGRRQWGTFIVCGLEICSAFGKECCPKYCCEVGGNVYEALPGIASFVHSSVWAGNSGLVNLPMSVHLTINGATILYTQHCVKPFCKKEYLKTKSPNTWVKLKSKLMHIQVALPSYPHNAQSW